jgi:hypothetical protein
LTGDSGDPDFRQVGEPDEGDDADPAEHLGLEAGEPPEFVFRGESAAVFLPPVEDVVVRFQVIVAGSFCGLDCFFRGGERGVNGSLVSFPQRFEVPASRDRHQPAVRTPSVRKPW